jgi:NADPH-dependent curcumin reductase CurA
MSQYQAAAPDPSLSLLLLRAVLVKRLTVKGFIIFDYAERIAEFRRDMQEWVQGGRIRYREDVVDGLEKAPAAFLGLMEGRNFGKLIVKVAD